MEKFQGMVETKLDGLEDKAREHNERIVALEKSQIEIAKINTLLEMQIETSKEQSKTLAKINDNLDRLNKGYDNLNVRMVAVEDNQKEIKTNSTIDLVGLKKDVITKIIPSIIGGVVLAWILIQFGLK